MHKAGDNTWEIRTTSKALWVQADNVNLIDGALMFDVIDDLGMRTVVFVVSPNVWETCHMTTAVFGPPTNARGSNIKDDNTKPPSGDQ